MNQENLPNCCGVDDVGNFRGVTNRHTGRIPSRPGTGLFTATFINTPWCRNAYNALCRANTLLFQSQPKMNRNSGQEVFLCVFQHRENVGNIPQL